MSSMLHYKTFNHSLGIEHHVYNKNAHTVKA